LSAKQPDEMRTHRDRPFDEVDCRNGRRPRTLSRWHTLSRRLSSARTRLAPGSRPATVGTKKGSTSCWTVEKASVTDSPERGRTRSYCDVRFGEHWRAGVPRQQNGNPLRDESRLPLASRAPFLWHRTQVAEDLSRGLRFRNRRGSKRSDQNGHSRYCEPTHCARFGGLKCRQKASTSPSKREKDRSDWTRGRAWQSLATSAQEALKTVVAWLQDNAT
jgi:hypothetical protein